MTREIREQVLEERRKYFGMVAYFESHDPTKSPGRLCNDVGKVAVLGE
jgi:hypothetical protein